MPSPFPGMDPFIEGQAWRDFHLMFIATARETLTRQLMPHYVVLSDETVYVEFQPPDGESARWISPDLFVAPPQREGGSATGTAVLASEPAILTLPMAVEYREARLIIRRRGNAEVVTAVEMLSPNNKRRGSDGRTKYLRKREAIIESRTHLVEIDLVRSGLHPPVVEPLPPADYYALVSRQQLRPKVEVRFWNLRDPMPKIPIPLAGSDPDSVLDLQEVFTTVYDRAHYEYGLGYDVPVEPPLPEADAEWVRQVLAARTAAGG